MQKIDPRFLVSAWAILVAQQVVCVFRWQTILHALRTGISYRPALVIYWTAIFFGLVFPGTVGGDAIRLLRTVRAGVALPTAVDSVLLERFATFAGLVAVASAALPFIDAGIPGRWFFPGATAIAIASIGCLAGLDRITGPLARWAAVRFSAQLASDTREVFFRPPTLLPMSFATLLAHVMLCASVDLLALGLGAHLTLIESLGLVPAIILISSLPISVGGWGTREFAMVTGLGFVGIGGAQALATSILFGLGVILSSLPGGVFWLFTRGKGAGAPT